MKLEHTVALGAKEMRLHRSDDVSIESGPVSPFSVTDSLVAVYTVL